MLKNLFLFILLILKINLSYNQTNKEIYKNLISHNKSIYDIKDSTILFKHELRNSFKNDTTYYTNCYYFKSLNLKYHSMIFSDKYFINKLYGNEKLTQSLKYYKLDTIKNIEKLNLDKETPHSDLYFFIFLIKKKRGEFSSKVYGEYEIEKIRDTFILNQKYKKEKRTRKLYFKQDYKIFKVEEFNYNEDEPDSYSCSEFQYYSHNCFDSLNKVHKLGFYTPITPKKEIKIIKDTIKSNSKIIYTFGNIDSILKIDSNKFYLFDYWYLSCSPCLQMMPFMNELHNKIDTNKLVIIGVNPYDKKINILNYLNKRNYHTIQLDKSKNIPFHIINEFPTLILMDGKFNHIKTFKGYSKYQEIDIIKYLNTLGLINTN